MKLLNALEKRFGFLAIHNLTLYIVVGQALVYGLTLVRRGQSADVLAAMMFTFERFVSGEVWRVLSFVLIPRSLHPIFIIFTLYVLYLMGGALEGRWGAFRYNLYFLVGIAGVVVAGFFNPYLPISNYHLLISITLAFAYLFPNFELLIFFVLPVKMKWIGWLIFAGVAFEFLQTGAGGRIVILGSLINFPIFFAADFFGGLKSKQRVSELKAAKRKFDSEPFHTCVRCGATDQTAPERDFRYRDEGAICSQCLEKDEQS